MKRRLLIALAIALMLVTTLSLPATAASEGSVPVTVDVVEIISITITDSPPAGIHFGSLNPGTNDNLDEDADGVTPSITVDVDGGSTTNVTLQIMGADFTGSGTITVDNAKYSTTYGGTKNALTTGYATFVLNTAPGTSADLWHWLNVPSGATAGSYTSDFSYKAIAYSP